MKMLKLLQETRALSSVTDRRMTGRSPGLFVLALRQQQLHPERKSKFLIRIDMCDLPEVPRPVSITHVQPPPGVARVAGTDLPARLETEPQNVETSPGLE